MPKATLLVVEDDVHLLGGIRDILELDDYRVITAQNGAQALEVLRQSSTPRPDLIVSDIMMPHMNGLELLQEVRKEDSWVLIPFIFLTAKGEKSDKLRGKMLGVDDYLIKPFDAEDLLVAVDSRLRRQQAMMKVQDGAISDVKRHIITILNHEMRTPLTLVIAYADMLKSFGSDDMSDEELLMFLRGVNSGAERLRRLIENFILMVELDSGDTEKTFSWRKGEIHNLDMILMAAHDQVMDGEHVQHKCHVEIASPLPTVTGDRDFLMVIVRELLDNAVKFSSPNQPIILRAGIESDNVLIEVIDHGRGIPESEQQNIWKSFYQIDRDHFEDQGAGSGLTIVKGLVELHGGQVHVDSREGAGSTFSVLLPIHKA